MYGRPSIQIIIYIYSIKFKVIKCCRLNPYALAKLQKIKAIKAVQEGKIDKESQDLSRKNLIEGIESKTAPLYIC